MTAKLREPFLNEYISKRKKSLTFFEKFGLYLSMISEL